MSIDTIESTTLDLRPSTRGELTWELARLYPRQGDWTEEQYLRVLALADDRIELVDGCLEFLPMANLLHFLLVDFLVDLFKSHCRSTGAPYRPIAAPTPVRIAERHLRDPDVYLLRAESLGGSRRRQPSVDEVALVIEVVSPGDEARERDFETKLAVYADAGIGEYWIVDPDEHRVVVHSLVGDVYAVHGEFGRGTTATSVLLPGLEVDVDAMFADAEGEG
jgi:Uma2 family endonuclease